MLEIYYFKDYKEFLRKKLSEWGSISRAAKAARCQRSYLSRVINGPVHLTPDQAFSLAVSWQLSSPESEYFVTLLEHARSASKNYREYLINKLKKIQMEQENLSNRLKRTRIESREKEVTYYSSWCWSAIHILTSIPEFQTVPSIAKRLSLSDSFVITILETLKTYELVEYKNGRWISSSLELHVPKCSPMVSVHHNNWRQRAVLHSQESASEGVHFTVVQSMSQMAFEKIKEKILSFINEYQKIAGPSEEEELVCVTCDLFRV